MLTLVKDSKAEPLVGIYSNKTKSRKPEAMLFFTPDLSREKENTAPAAGVLELHRSSLKKINKISQTSFEHICSMLDLNQEPELGDPLKSEYWEIKRVYERSLKREFYLGDQDELRFELNLPRDRTTWGGLTPASATAGRARRGGWSTCVCATCAGPSPTRGAP